MTLAAVVLGCGPGDSGGNDPDGAPPPPPPDAAPPPPDGPPPVLPSTITGTVWAPGNAPGFVPAGHEIPISRAVVYLTTAQPQPIPQEVFCEPCQDVSGNVYLTDSKGQFEIPNVFPGAYWLVIQKGQFRLDQQILVNEGETLVLPAEQTTLPSTHDPSNGMWVPRIALAEGLWDNMEDILGKMGIGMVSAGGVFVGSSADGNFDLYDNGTGDHESYAIGTLNGLVADLAKMMQYHIILVPCSNGSNAELFTNPTLRENIREYVKAGGKFYVTDWSAEWADAVFPEFIEFNADHDTTAAEAAAGQFDDGDGFPGYESHNAKAMDQDLNAWLNGQKGPLVAGGGDYTVGTVNADSFVVEGNYDHIANLPTIVIGQDPVTGMDVHEQAYPWVQGDWQAGEGPIHPLTVTFEPLGCGRVLYSTYHTADATHVGLVPQERVLLYLLMEIGTCKEGPIVE